MCKLTVYIEFDPKGVFDTVYKTPCLQALHSTYCDPILIEYICQLIKTQMQNMFPLVGKGRSSSANFHWRNMRQIACWDQIKSNTICLCCIRRKPEHVLTCGHALCDVCVEIFGNALTKHEYRYELACILCSRGSVIASIKPPTAGIRIISIDGGGSRGVIPLERMRLFQDILGDSCQIQDLFDLAMGTSSGKLSSLLVLQNSN